MSSPRFDKSIWCVITFCSAYITRDMSTLVNFRTFWLSRFEVSCFAIDDRREESKTKTNADENPQFFLSVPVFLLPDGFGPIRGISRWEMTWKESRHARELIPILLSCLPGRTSLHFPSSSQLLSYPFLPSFWVSPRYFQYFYVLIVSFSIPIYCCKHWGGICAKFFCFFWKIN